MMMLSAEVRDMKRIFSYKERYEKLLTPEIVSFLSTIHEHKGRQALFIETQADFLAELLEIAKIQSTEASNRIEGIVTTHERLKNLVREKTTPKNRSEREIAGYRDVLATIHESYDFIPVKPGMILQLHRDLYKFSGTESGGAFKHTDNVIAEKGVDGTERVRFTPVAAWETPEAMDRLCDAFHTALRDDDIDALVLMPMFVLDFLCIHPFHDGNGRMSRLLTLLLLYRAGFLAGKYISIEKQIADSKESYYEALEESSAGWHEGKNDDLPFVRYMLGVTTAAYRELSSRMELLADGSLPKTGRIREVIRRTIGRQTKAEIMEKCPDISKITVERALKEMMDSGEVLKIGGGRYTWYVWNGEKE